MMPPALTTTRRTVREFVKDRTRRRRIFVRTGSDCNMHQLQEKKRLGGPGQRKHACKIGASSITYANDAARIFVLEVVIAKW